jgi:ribosomal protein S18 acetylase RimI-like enzyme
MNEKKIVKVDLENKIHSAALLHLLNDYMLDDMGIGKQMPENLGPKIVEGLKKHSGYLGFFVCIGEDFTALANCNLVFSTWKAKPLINIHDFIVSPKFRKKGIGQFLMNSIIDYAKSNGYCKINLEVRHDNIKAQNLYLKTGFVECDPPNYFWENKLK